MIALFRYADEILDAFPTTQGGVIHAIGLANDAPQRDLVAAYEAEQRLVRDQLGDSPLAEVPTLAAWRRTFTAFGVKPTQYRSAAEALLRRLTKQGDIPSISPLVDVANLVSIRYRLPVAVFDQSQATGTTTVRFATGTERFTDLGATEESHPEPGEVVFVDDDDLVSARRWCWRQSDQSATRPITTEALITVEGHHADAATDVGAAVRDLLDLLATYQHNATTTSAMLSVEVPEFAI